MEECSTGTAQRKRNERGNKRGTEAARRGGKQRKLKHDDESGNFPHLVTSDTFLRNSHYRAAAGALPGRGPLGWRDYATSTSSRLRPPRWASTSRSSNRPARNQRAAHSRAQWRAHGYPTPTISIRAPASRGAHRRAHRFGSAKQTVQGFVEAPAAISIPFPGGFDLDSPRALS